MAPPPWLVKEARRRKRTTEGFFSRASSAWRSLVALAVQLLLRILPMLVQDVLLSSRSVRTFVIYALQNQWLDIVRRRIRTVDSLECSFEKMKYYIGEPAKRLILHAAGLGLAWKKDTHERLTEELPFVGKILLMAPEGSKKFQETIVECTASEFGASLLVVDSVLLTELSRVTVGEDLLDRIDQAWDSNESDGIGSLLLSLVLSGGRSCFAFEIVRFYCQHSRSPMVLYFPTAEELLCGNIDRYSAFIEVFGDCTDPPPMRGEGTGKSSPPMVMMASSMLANRGKGLVAPSLTGSSDFEREHLDMEGIGALLAAPTESGSNFAERKAAEVRGMLSSLFSVKVRLDPPTEGIKAAQVHMDQLKQDAEDLVEDENRMILKAVALSRGILVPEKSSRVYRKHRFTRSDWAKVLSWAVSLRLAHIQLMKGEVDVNGSQDRQVETSTSHADEKVSREKVCLRDLFQILGFGCRQEKKFLAQPWFENGFQVRETDLLYGIRMLQDSSGIMKSIVHPDNQYEKRILAEVLSPEGAGSGFCEVGGMKKAKDALREAVQLPLQHPELFRAGRLAQMSKGVLLFGPPGTGKTLLARAAASECGASFLTISPSSFASKWFGDGVRLVRATFAIASKISPCIVFIDEVDALLGRRDSQSEHEAMREIKNEFMSLWDGIRSTKQGMQGDKIVVLGATNRPQDLDEAVLRRFNRRIFCDLPDLDARKAILGVLLSREANICRETQDSLISEVAERTNGYCGSDLRSVCMAAAWRPLRELLKSSSDGKERAVEELGSTTQGQEEAPHSLVPFDRLNRLTSSCDALVMDEYRQKVPRSVELEDFDAALKEVKGTVDPDSPSLNELKTWNAKYGEGSRGQGFDEKLSYFL